MRPGRRRRLSRPQAHGDSQGVRFIHVEIYKDNDPAKGVNRWVKEWRLPTEPFTFVVDRTGVIRAKLEGAFSVAELERAVEGRLPLDPAVALADAPRRRGVTGGRSRAITCASEVTLLYIVKR